MKCECRLTAGPALGHQVAHRGHSLEEVELIEVHKDYECGRWLGGETQPLLSNLLGGMPAGEPRFVGGLAGAARDLPSVEHLG
jgi:hypothetical protein